MSFSALPSADEADVQDASKVYEVMNACQCREEHAIKLLKVKFSVASACCYVLIPLTAV